MIDGANRMQRKKYFDSVNLFFVDLCLGIIWKCYVEDVFD